jgi:hypothetical protein
MLIGFLASWARGSGREMRLKAVMRWGIVLGIGLWTAACHDLLYPPHVYSGPGCLIYIYPNADFKGTPLPIRGDTVQLADPWQHLASSARVVYGSWRLYSEPEFVGFMGDYKAPADLRLLPIDRHLGSLQCTEPAPEPK